MTDDDFANLALQNRCLQCLGDIHGHAILTYSQGGTRCHECGHTTQPMTRNEYLQALRDVYAKQAQAAYHHQLRPAPRQRHP